MRKEFALFNEKYDITRTDGNGIINAFFQGGSVPDGVQAVMTAKLYPAGGAEPIIMGTAGMNAKQRVDAMSISFPSKGWRKL